MAVFVPGELEQSPQLAEPKPTMRNVPSQIWHRKTKQFAIIAIIAFLEVLCTGLLANVHSLKFIRIQLHRGCVENMPGPLQWNTGRLITLNDVCFAMLPIGF